MSSNKDFYAWQEYDEEATRAIQKFYVPFFEGREKVLDIACGRGEFMKLLKENGISAIGIDIEDTASAAAKEASQQIVQADVFEYLADEKTGQFDGIFISHFLEHLPYERIAELIGLCRNALVPNGILVASFPSVSSIGMHLDWFYRDSTHAGFRHPQTIAFMLANAGFEVQKTGGNPATLLPYLGDQAAKIKNASIVLGRNREDLLALEQQLAGLDDDLVKTVKSSLRGQRGIKSLVKRMWGALTLPGVKPYLDESSRRQSLVRTMYVDRLRVTNDELISTTGALAECLDKLDHSFEDYVIAKKGSPHNE